MRELALFDLSDRVVLKTLSQLLLKSHEQVFTSPPLHVKINPELWADVNLDMANEIKTSIKYLDSGNIAGYDSFISSEYSNTLKDLIDFNTPHLLEYYNRMRKVPIMRKIFKPLAKRKLNKLRTKLGMPRIYGLFLW